MSEEDEKPKLPKKPPLKTVRIDMGYDPEKDSNNKGAKKRNQRKE